MLTNLSKALSNLSVKSAKKEKLPSLRTILQVNLGQWHKFLKIPRRITKTINYVETFGTIC